MVSSFNIRHAALAIKQGGIIAYPTEAVYGLGCDPYQQAAVIQLLKLKDRPPEKGLILIASKLQQLDDFIDPLNNDQQQKIQNNPHTTWLVPATNAPFWIRGRHNTVAVRLSAHSLVKQLCDAVEQPIVSTSANPAGRIPAKNSLQTHHYFHHELDIIINSNTSGHTKPTEIRDLLTDKIIRSS